MKTQKVYPPSFEGHYQCMCPNKKRKSTEKEEDHRIRTSNQYPA